MKPFQMLSLGLAALLLVVTYLDYKEKKSMNNFIKGAKKPCSCSDHSESGANLDGAPAPSTTDGNNALAVAGL
ncbi:hypothetical protein [Aureispira sp. CCB-E]|uniref:hypothetical protein n=1 Tax=Aureispira sp. CCB-E TaxID=3051121 RepID=UPI002868A807|nr:hypothetical protein [Aureispira sp. CCB-E]WMX17482.1 hypothetical protein QP953_13960 [Aureispira sp. CCB-E]